MNSLRFVQQRIHSPNYTYQLTDDYNIHSLPFFEMAQNFLPNKVITRYQDTHEIIVTVPEGEMMNEVGELLHLTNYNIHLKYDPDADFEYVTSERITHDGTATFVIYLYSKVLNNILFGQTHDRTKIPEDFYNNINDYKIEIVHGDFVQITEHGAFGDTTKPWLHARDTVLLPVIWNCYKIK